MKLSFRKLVRVVFRCKCMFYFLKPLTRIFHVYTKLNTFRL